MIPAPIFSGAFFIVLGISFLATVSVLAWAATLALSSRARRWFRTHRVRASGLFGTLCVSSSFFVVLAIAYLQIDLHSRKEEAALHPTLEKAEHLLGVDMPAGTRLSLGTAGNIASIGEAAFPHEVSVYGIPAVAMGVKSEYDDETPWNDQSPVTLTALSLTVTGPRPIDGWVCGPGGPLEIVLRKDARIKTLWWCNLAEGNRVAGSLVPAGSTLIRSTTLYLDGLRDNDYWRLAVADGAIFELAGLPLRSPVLNLDRQHRVVTHTSATLARAATVGEITYPAGTEVSSLSPGFRKKYPGAWVFTPAPGQPAVSRTDGAIANDMSVVQAPSGKAYALIRNRRH
ncbi:hypothetical protein BLA50215_01649 [Burkholderia lata]|uniref:hypothetical protein n=1 Tax=Burkholderia lata (strain ATCC 17760 / DSM 23089 / LMG 22485 / NCIMB 9086 / R18194 / 383) TaxID=482957 RepID=UPI0014545B29|nr:hypothetical protein [Burkholderia lata]VWC87221.1 hypothetical protein BLA50215_01649 [Burkholderia lata]